MIPTTSPRCGARPTGRTAISPASTTRGIANAGYRQGPYAVDEKLVGAFKDFYVDRARAALEQVV